MPTTPLFPLQEHQFFVSKLFQPSHHLQPKILGHSDTLEVTLDDFHQFWTCWPGKSGLWPFKVETQFLLGTRKETLQKEATLKVVNVQRSSLSLSFESSQSYATHEITCGSLYTTAAPASGSRELQCITWLYILHPLFAALAPNRPAELLCHRPSYQSD